MGSMKTVPSASQIGQVRYELLKLRGRLAQLQPRVESEVEVSQEYHKLLEAEETLTRTFLVGMIVRTLVNAQA